MPVEVKDLTRVGPKSPPRPDDAPRRPSNRQWWKIAQEALRLLDVDVPQDRREASALIDRMLATNGAKAPDEVPF